MNVPVAQQRRGDILHILPVMNNPEYLNVYRLTPGLSEPPDYCRIAPDDSGLNQEKTDKK
ncbi:hypothetical protein OkiPb00453_48400 [Escherichia coli]